MIRYTSIPVGCNSKERRKTIPQANTITPPTMPKGGPIIHLENDLDMIQKNEKSLTHGRKIHPPYVFLKAFFCFSKPKESPL